jgi:hypothetical protein
MEEQNRLEKDGRYCAYLKKPLAWCFSEVSDPDEGEGSQGKKGLVHRCRRSASCDTEISQEKRKSAPRVFSSYTDKLHYPKKNKEKLLQTRDGTGRMVIGHPVDLDFALKTTMRFRRSRPILPQSVLEVTIGSW